MKKQLLKVFVAAAAIAFFAGAGCATTKTEGSEAPQAAATHEEHHETQAAAKDAAAGEGMMGKMDMNKMMEMKHECMAKHKSGKTCDRETMKMCEEHMKKGECQDMMKHAKAKDKSQTKKK